MASTMQKKSHHALMHIIVILFGIGAWIAINGVWVELPILVEQLPEGWGLPSFLIILTQAANVGPLVVALMQRFLPKYYHQNVLIYIMLVMGTIACFLLIFFWDSTAYINGKEHSVALFALFLVLGFVDCTSSLTFMPFMTKFQVVFLTTYFIGEGLSGFLPSIFALIQGTSVAYCSNETFVNTTSNETQYHIVTKYGEPRFSVEVFFVILTLMMAGCFAAFIMLNHLHIVKSFRPDYKDKSDQDRTDPSTLDIDIGRSTSTELTSFGSNSTVDSSYSRGCVTNDNEVVITSLTEQNKLQQLSTKHYAYLYLIVFWVSGISNGVMPSVISYYSLPYGQLPYHFSTSLGTMANPVACFIALFLPVKSFTIVGAFTVVTTGFAGFLMFLAVESPCPVFVGTDGGAVLMVVSQIAFVFTTSYAKVSIGQILRERGFEKSLVWYGAFTQLGALTGACIIFPLVNVLYLFTPGDQCTTVC